MSFPLRSVGSGGDSKSSFHEDGEEDVVGSGEEEDEQGPDQVIKHSFKKFTTELDAGKAAAALADLQRPVTPPEKRRQNLLDKYHALLKEKRELRKRNAQAQTNICQYLRKHNIDLFPHLTELDKSQVRQLAFITLATHSTTQNTSSPILVSKTIIFQDENCPFFSERITR